MANRAYFNAMGRHDHHLHEGESLHDAARDRLTARGEQWTDMRQAVFKALAGLPSGLGL